MATLFGDDCTLSLAFSAQVAFLYRSAGSAHYKREYTDGWIRKERRFTDDDQDGQRGSEDTRADFAVYTVLSTHGEEDNPYERPRYFSLGVPPTSPRKSTAQGVRSKDRT